MLESQVNMNTTEEINKLLEEYAKRTKQKIDPIKDTNNQSEFSGRMTEEERKKFYDQQTEIYKKHKEKEEPPPEGAETTDI